MLVLDTDVLTLLQRGAGPAFENLTARLKAASPQPVYTTVISLEEQLRGWLRVIARAKTLDAQIEAYVRLRALVEDFQSRPMLDFDASAAVHLQRLMKSRVRIGTMDLRIAAIALSRDARLVSRNLVDFRKVPGLVVEDWTR